MKKLSLGKLRLLSDEVLDRSQLGSIYGGSGCGSDESPYCLQCDQWTWTHSIPVNDCSRGTAKFYCGSEEGDLDKSRCVAGPCNT
ncbi:hypothetical protein ESV85_16775 [Algoriphagus aquimarinus]|uniref:Natural product n=1 Tax=Algoriphagus aquimarinus TaxID=237018 RepID=A0A5C7AKW1_9BACT|nr:hypothetical protein ESV85_16775 [Algoriphagus aquimarinus]